MRERRSLWRRIRKWWWLRSGKALARETGRADAWQAEATALRARLTVTPEAIVALAKLLYDETYEWKACTSFSDASDELRTWHLNLAKQIVELLGTGARG
jgi:hypothetical protein